MVILLMTGGLALAQAGGGGGGAGVAGVAPVLALAAAVLREPPGVAPGSLPDQDQARSVPLILPLAGPPDRRLA